MLLLVVLRDLLFRTSCYLSLNWLTDGFPHVRHAKSTQLNETPILYVIFLFSGEITQ